MRFNPFYSHRFLVNTVIALLLLAFFLSAFFGELKAKEHIQWLDVLGEGGIVLMTLSWITALLVSRPAGKVTRYLVCGLAIFMFSATLDLLDEWLIQPSQLWLSWIESLPAPIGMLLTSLGLYYWHQEQYVLNKQLRRREAHLRQHDKVCPITGLYKADYLQKVLTDQLKVGKPVIVGAIDVRDFSLFNREFGFYEGDRLLREISELILMNCRVGDVVCRYAGDCFMILMPATSTAQGQELLRQIKSALAHCAFKVEGIKKARFQHVTTEFVVGTPQQYAHDITHQLQLKLQQQKQQRAQQREQLC
ncbi:GGDEF domain-containing protein [Pseudoalteromonas sp. MMG010]|uniref:GGDEF domain-containing protein n=1 Tax=Pseudoalteromonas sp. MMG010 TaxID=2822685 RepID=UPI001B3A23BA|nr:GGDEF domain-containing protein [Pseudoalteromonas sp. MMG010]MBQ4833138.1 GGDEF domain-containing protein [Pseudoalteromonas sp. MMG010]